MKESSSLKIEITTRIESDFVRKERWGEYNPQEIEKLVRDIATELELHEKIKAIVIHLTDITPGATLLGGIKGNLVALCLDADTMNEGVIRHELMHIADQLNPEFEYNLKIELEYDGISALVNEVWNANIDGRIARTHRNGISKEERFEHFSKEFPNMPKEDIKRVFNRLWTSDMISYPKLIEIAVHPFPYASIEKQKSDG